MSAGRDASSRPGNEPYAIRFRRSMSHLQSLHAPVVNVSRRRRSSMWTGEFPFASLSVLIILASLFLLSMHLGGWTWSSWTYAFSLSIAVPLVAIEVRKKAVITGAALFLLFFTVVIDAGLPRYFGYSPSDLSWYDLTAHYLGTLLLTVLLWSVLCWTWSNGEGHVETRARFFAAVMTVLMVSMIFEVLELSTDSLLGWGNSRGVVDTVGDMIFDLAGIFTAAILIARHRFIAIRRPFWHSEPVTA
ncbi:TPA: hypothetical protein HA259_03180 [Thermoplasmata archaeon]|nr:hypothetical protein [Thermoplasmata archaeon]